MKTPNRLLSWGMIVVFILSLIAIPGENVQAAPTELFFSEYIEGSSNNKALEIYNGTGASIDLSAGGYNIQMYFNGSGTAGLTINLTGTVANGDVYVVAHSSANATILAQADQTNGSGWFNGDDAVVLRRGTTVIDVIGQIGLDPGSEWGSGLQSTADNTLRRMNAIEAGDTNGSDVFVPSAQWDGYAIDTFSGLGFHCLGECAPFVVSTSPANNAINVALNSNITINFSEPVNWNTGEYFTLACDQYDWTGAGMTGNSTTTFSIDFTPDFLSNDRCTLTINAANIMDTDTNDPPDNMAADYSFTFYTVVTDRPIHTVQGAGHMSAFNGWPVQVTGIVTALRTTGSTRGFYLQEPNGSSDTDLATSEAIFVFTGSSSNPASLVAVGDMAQVTGTVFEYRGGATGLTLTELTSPTVVVLSSGNPLPTVTLIGASGRVPPTTFIEDGAGNVESGLTFDLASDGIDFWESLEGMYVQVNNAAVVGPYANFTSNHEIPVVVDGGAAAGVRTTRGGVVIGEDYTDFNPERIILNDWISGGPVFPTASVGDSFSGATTGVIDYSFNNFKLQVISLGTYTSGGLAQEVATVPASDELSVATFNVENLDPGDGAAKFNALAELIVNHLRSPDILVIEEVQDNNGPTNDAVVASDVTWNTLIAAITTAGGPAYQYRQIDPVDDQDGGEGGGNIRVGFLFRTDRGLAFVDRPGAGSTTANAVLSGATGPTLQYSPGRINPTSAAFSTSRKPLAGEFTFRGQTVFVIANHFNSKGGDEPLYGFHQPPTLSSETQRLQQATEVRNFVQAILALDPNANIIVAGDLNDFQFSPPLTTLEGAPLHTLIETLPAAERYTYVYEGNSQAIDHTLLSNALFSRPFTYDVVHVNSEFASQLSDHEPQVTHIRLDNGPIVLFGANTVPADGAVLAAGPTQISVEYSRDVVGDGGANAANNPANYMLVGEGTPSGFQTLSCAGGLAVGDDHITIQSVTYNNNGGAGPFIATLNINSGVPLPIGTYRLYVCGTTSVRDLFGTVLNGGLDTVITFRVGVTGLPATGFAPGQVTLLPQQPAESAYATLGDLWLEIPRLGVRTDIVGVSMTNNSWDVAWLGQNAGWLQGSAFPTWAGNSAITGHVYDANGQPGPFINLNQLWYGDRIVVHAFGQEYVYEVRSVRRVTPEDTQWVTRHEDLPWLTLLTCKGYDEASNAYRYRVIVRAVLVEIR